MKLFHINFPSYSSYYLVWPMSLAQVWTHYKIRKLNMWTLFCNVCINFLNNQIWKEIMFELNDKPTSVTTFSTDFLFQNLVFWNLFELLVAKIIFISVSPTFWIQILPINSIKACSSRSFQQHQRHVPIPPKLSTRV